MAFIKTQKIVRDESGKIISGSASIVETIYGDFDTYHAKLKIREWLGRVISLSDDKKSGVFLSPTRDLVEYDSSSDTFSDVEREDECISDSDVFVVSDMGNFADGVWRNVSCRGYRIPRSSRGTKLKDELHVYLVGH